MKRYALPPLVLLTLIGIVVWGPWVLVLGLLAAMIGGAIDGMTEGND